MKNKGFTLVELLAVIIIMAVIIIISTYGVNVAKKTINERLWNNKVELIQNSAENWAEDNKEKFSSDSCLYVGVDTLIRRGYLHTTEKDSSGNGIITNNTNGQVVTGNVKVCLDNGSFYGTYPASS